MQIAPTEQLSVLCVEALCRLIQLHLDNRIGRNPLADSSRPELGASLHQGNGEVAWTRATMDQVLEKAKHSRSPATRARAKAFHPRLRIFRNQHWHPTYRCPRLAVVRPRRPRRKASCWVPFSPTWAILQPCRQPLRRECRLSRVPMQDQRASSCTSKSRARPKRGRNCSGSQKTDRPS